MKSGEIIKTEGLQADVVIVGGGASGLSAAVSAAEADAKKVIVVEKAKITGGNGRISAGFFFRRSPDLWSGFFTRERTCGGVTPDERAG